MSDATGTEGRNRLGEERSPYLLQHADNPVHWWPWSEEAFERARERDVPVFLSIGYSTCHWCHVMEEESFEDESIAELLNRHFVPIKVDREERPDVDAVYMAAAQAMTGQGGWPLSVFLTPDGHPFFGGTYFPPEDRLGRPGFRSLLQRIHRLWEEEREELVRTGARLRESLQTGQSKEPSDSVPDRAILDDFVEMQERRFDETHGGFGGPPKFPRSSSLDLLLRHHVLDDDDRALTMVERTLEAMRLGGMYDHVGGGFHRYSTDRKWLVPHFEKMLYDQALLARTYAQAHQVTGRDLWAETARETLDYILRDLRDPGGAFQSAEDADSEGEEGRFYTWTPEELDDALDGEAARLVRQVWHVTKAGHLDGRSILHLDRPVRELADARGEDPDELAARLEEARQALFEAREDRVRPHLDDKVLTDWNGLVISSLAVTGGAIDEPAYIEAAIEAHEFIEANLVDDDGRLLHVWRDGEARVPGFLDDHAFLALGLLDLYAQTLDPSYLERARELADRLLADFLDPADGAFRMTPEGGEELITDPKDAYDGATPSGNSVAALVLSRLGHLTGDSTYENPAVGLVMAFARDLRKAPVAYPVMLWALDDLRDPGLECVLVGDPSDDAFERMARAYRRRFVPDGILLHGDEATAEIVPFVGDLEMKEGKTTAYLCQNRTCDLPTTDPAELEDQLEEATRPGARTP